MTVLGIDTCDKTAACAIVSDMGVLAESAFVTEHTHSQVILPLAKRVLADAGLDMKDIDVFAAISGPGSYTGLRIGISAVQGICYALDRKCVGVSALEALVYELVAYEGVVCAVMHARQDLMYNAFFRISDGKVERLTPDSIDKAEDVVSSMSRFDGVLVTGDVSYLSYDNTPSVRTAPVHLRRRTAVGLCCAAMTKEPAEPGLLMPDYLQITKAEKDLENG